MGWGGLRGRVWDGVVWVVECGVGWGGLGGRVWGGVGWSRG